MVKVKDDYEGEYSMLSVILLTSTDTLSAVQVHNYKVLSYSTKVNILSARHAAHAP